MVRLSGLAAAVVFLTRVPLRLRVRDDHGTNAAQLARAVPWFPVVGALVGCVVGGVAAGLWHLVPAPVAATAGVLTGVLITGAFHEDGLADVADAFVGGWDLEQRMRILKDPLHGTYGVAALCGTIVLRVVALASVAGAGPLAVLATSVAVHALARSGAVGLMLTAPVATVDGLGAGYVHDLARPRAIVGAVAGVAIAVAATGWWAAPMAAAAGGAAVAVGSWAMRKIGGITGDVLGAAEQVAECLCLVVATGLAGRYAMW